MSMSIDVLAALHAPVSLHLSPTFQHANWLRFSSSTKKKVIPKVQSPELSTQLARIFQKLPCQSKIEDIVL